MRALVDTCVILDVLQRREPFFEDALRLLQAAADKEFACILTAKSITDIYYILRRALHDDKQVRAHIQKLYALFEIADTFALDCELALFSETKDYEDAVMIETAVRVGADCIVTRNLKDFANSKLPVHSPKVFLENLLEKQA